MHDFELYGFSLFETMLARKGHIQQLEAHWQRMYRSALQLLMTPPDLATFRQCVKQDLDPDCDQVVRLSLMRHGGRWQPGAQAEDRLHVLIKPHSGTMLQAVSLATAKQAMPVGDRLRWHKTGNRLAYQMLAQQAQNDGFDDCLHFDQHDTVLETTNCNLLCLLDGVWLTPSYESCILPGIMRQSLLNAGLIQEARIQLAELQNMHALAVSNAVWGVVPVNRLDDKRYAIDDALALKANIASLLNR